MPYECTEHDQTYDTAPELLAHLRDTVHAEVNVSSQCRCGADAKSTYQGKMPDGVSNVHVMCENCLKAACEAKGWTVTIPEPEEPEEGETPESE